MKEIFPSLLDPKKYIQSESERRIARELDVATEIFLAEKCARIHYENLMSDVEPGKATKSMLIGWLNDSIRNGELVRLGIINAYMAECPDDFEEGKWKPMYFGHFLHFAALRLTDKAFVGAKSKAQLFSLSIRDPQWFAKASAVMGLKLLESVFYKGGIKSAVANSILEINFNNRQLLESHARIVGRAVKNNGGFDEIKDDLQDSFEDFFQTQSRLMLRRYEQREEYDLFERHKAAISSAIAEVPRLLSLY